MMIINIYSIQMHIIIDFSRSIILPSKIDNLYDDSLPKSYSVLKNSKKFHENQTESLLNLYSQYASDVNKDELQTLFKNNFEAVFKLLSITDIFGFTKKLLTLFDMNDKKIIKPYSKCIDLLDNMNKYAEQYLTIELNKLILDKNYEKTILSGNYPIYNLIKHCFCENSVNNIKINKIVDVYNVNNKIKYSLNKLDNYPPILKNPKQIVKNKIVDETFHKEFMKHRKTYESKKNDGMKVVNYIATRQREKHI